MLREGARNGNKSEDLPCESYVHCFRGKSGEFNERGLARPIISFILTDSEKVSGINFCQSLLNEDVRTK